MKRALLWQRVPKKRLGVEPVLVPSLIPSTYNASEMTVLAEPAPPGGEVPERHPLTGATRMAFRRAVLPSWGGCNGWTAPLCWLRVGGPRESRAQFRPKDQARNTAQSWGDYPTTPTPKQKHVTPARAAILGLALGWTMDESSNRQVCFVQQAH